MNISIRVPISPSPNYLNRLVVLARSARAAGGILASARIEAFVSPDRVAAPPAWIAHLAEFGVDWVDVPVDQFAIHGYGATGIERFRRPSDADIHVMADADLLFAGSLDDAIQRCVERQTVLGVTAYRSPFTTSSYPPRHELDRRSCWIDLFERVGLTAPTFTSRHPAGYESDWDPDSSMCPTYFNYGLLVLRRDQAELLGESLYDEHRRIVEHFTGAHAGQIAFAAALQRQGLTGEELAIRYNFPNQEPYVDAYPEDFADLRVLHYMNAKHFKKESDLDSAAQLRAWMSGDSPDRIHRVLAHHFQDHEHALADCPWNEKP